MFTAMTLPLAGSGVRAAWVTSIAETISGFRHLESDRVGWFKDGSWLKELP